MTAQPPGPYFRFGLQHTIESMPLRLYPTLKLDLGPGVPPMPVDMDARHDSMNRNSRRVIRMVFWFSGRG
jgi:hypothetical protein